MSDQTSTKAPFWHSWRFKKNLSRSLRYLIAALLLTFAFIPIIWVTSTSFNPAKSLGGGLWIKNPVITNYKELLHNDFFPFPTWLFNSLKVASITALLTIILTSLNGYALSRFHFRGQETLMTLILILNVFPSILSMVAIFSMSQQMGLFVPILGLDNHGSLILFLTAGTMGINSLMVKSYIDAIPKELDESALVEGATYWQTFRYIIFPILTPIVITVGILSFIAAYGDFIIARILLKSSEKLTVMVGLMLFRTDRFDQDFGIITAGAVMAALPILLMYIPLQKYIISGLTSGAVKE